MSTTPLLRSTIARSTHSPPCLQDNARLGRGATIIRFKPLYCLACPQLYHSCSKRPSARPQTQQLYQPASLIKPQRRCLNALPLRENKETIYILGTGAVGKVVAHALRNNSPRPPPVTLIFHRPSLIQKWLHSDRTLLVETYGDQEVSKGYNVELALPHRKAVGDYNPDERREKLEDQYRHFLKRDPIKHLIVTVKATATLSGLRSIRHRINRDTSILFLQNGMGIVDEVNEQLFPDPQERPNYLVGINSHGMTEGGAFVTKHVGHGTMYISILPRGGDGQDKGVFSETSRALLQELIQLPILAAIPLEPSALLQAQLEKLVVNCLINPLTVMFDCRNGDLLHNNGASRVFRLLLAEICLVIQNLPELQSNPNLTNRFNSARLETLTVSIAKKTSQNISSMLQDVRRGRETEIKYINGYIVRRGEELGIKCLMNYMLMQMVHGKYHMIAKEVNGYTPFEKVRTKELPARNS